MEKVIIMITIMLLSMQAKESSLQQTCLDCHQAQQIPSEMIYKRYLMKYSTDSYMKEAIFAYLRAPKKERSIMPKAFFLKFPMKEKLIESDEALRENIQQYLDYFDLKKRLINKNNSH